MDTSHPKIRLLLRSLYLLEFERARQQVEEIRALEPDLGLLADAILCFYLGEFDEALELFDEAADAGVEEPALPLYHALALKELGRLREAIAVLEPGVLRHVGDATLSSALGRLYIEAGEPRRALERLHAGRPGQGAVEARRSRGEALERLGNADAALVEYEAAIREFPFDEGLMDRARALYLSSGQVERGALFFGGLQKKRQIDRLAMLHNLGLLLLAAGKPTRVDDVCRKLEAAVPNDHFALPYLAALLERLGKSRKLKALHAAHDTPDVAAEIRADLAAAAARAWLADGLPRRARAVVEAGLRVAPFHRGLGDVASALGPAGEAVADRDDGPGGGDGASGDDGLNDG